MQNRQSQKLQRRLLWKTFSNILTHFHPIAASNVDFSLLSESQSTTKTVGALSDGDLHRLAVLYRDTNFSLNGRLIILTQTEVKHSVKRNLTILQVPKMQH